MSSQPSSLSLRYVRLLTFYLSALTLLTVGRLEQHRPLFQILFFGTAFSYERLFCSEHLFSSKRLLCSLKQLTAGGKLLLFSFAVLCCLTQIQHMGDYALFKYLGMSFVLISLILFCPNTADFSESVIHFVTFLSLLVLLLIFLDVEGLWFKQRLSARLHPNGLAYLLCLTCPFVLMDGRRSSLFRVFLITALISLIVATRCRTVLFILVIYLLTFASYFYRFQFKPYKKYVFGAVLGLLLLGSFNWNFLSRKDDEEGRIFDRPAIWQKAIEKIAENPWFGGGMGKRAIVYTFAGAEDFAATAHNSFLDTAIIGGVGLAILSFLLALMPLSPILVRFKKGELGISDTPFDGILFLVGIGMVVFGFFESRTFTPGVAYGVLGWGAAVTSMRCFLLRREPSLESPEQEARYFNPR